MDEILQLLKKNKELLTQILSNQNKIEELMSPNNSPIVASNDPFNELNIYYEKNNSGNLNWYCGSCLDEEVSSIKATAKNPTVWHDVACKYPLSNTLRDTFKKLGFNEHQTSSGHIFQTRMFIYAS